MGQTVVQLYYANIVTPDTMDADSPNADDCHIRPITPPVARLESLVNNIPALRCLLQCMSHKAHQALHGQ